MDVMAAVFGAGTIFLAVGVSLPQYFRVRRHGGTAGVSLPAALNSAISFFAWTVYAIWIGDPWLIVSSALGVPFAIAMALALWRSSIDHEGLWVPTLWVGILLMSCLLQGLGGWNLVGWSVGASIGWSIVPATVKAWTSKDVSGIAAGTWWVSAAEGGLFLGYGLFGGAWASMIYGVVALLGSAAVLTRIALGLASPP